MSISVALAVYNGEKYIEKQLRSIKEQELPPSEIIIINDCSTDMSDKIIRDFDFGNILMRYYKNEENLGVIVTFKKLIELCEGECIATCDQDDIWLPNKLKLSYEAMQSLDQSRPCVVYTDLTLMDKDEKIIEPSLYKSWGINPAKYPFKLVLFDNVIIGCTAFFNKEMKSKLALMPTDIIMHDYWIALIGYSFGMFKYIEQSTILYRSHQGSVTSKDKKTKLQNIIADIRNRKDYLMKNIKQALAFFNAYQEYLDKLDEKTLQGFLLLKKKPFLYKRIYAKLLKLYVVKLNRSV